MIKVFFKHNFLAIFAIGFLLPVIILGFLALGNQAGYNDILANGIEVEAEVIEGSERSSITVDDISYYKIDFEFEDEEGYKHVGTTSETFTFYDIQRLVAKGTITIKYDPETFDAIEASYDFLNDDGKMGLLLGFAIFGIVDVFLWVVVIKIGINNISNKQVAEKGEDFTATVSYINSNVTINGVPKYKVHYTWVGGDGTTKSASSGSVYMLHEAEALEQAKTIDIKVIGKRSVIMTSPDTCLHQHYNNVEGSVADKNTQQLKCDYCGHHITESDEYCSNCGARVNFNKY